MNDYSKGNHKEFKIVAIYIDYLCDFLFNNVGKKGDILKNKEALETLYGFGREGAFLN